MTARSHINNEPSVLLHRKPFMSGITVMTLRGVVILLCVPSVLLGQEPGKRGFFAVNGTKLYYEIAGAGPPVVLIHGGWLNSSQWDERPHLIGVSAGAQAAIDFALNHPGKIASLLVGASPLGGYDIGKEFTDGVAGIVAAGAADDLQLLHDRVWAFAPFQVAIKIPAARSRLNDMVIRQNTWAGQRQGAPRPRRAETPPARRLSEIAVPTLIVVGDGEMGALRAEAEFLARNIRGARLTIIKGAGHFPNLERPKRFNDVVTRWLHEQIRSLPGVR